LKNLLMGCADIIGINAIFRVINKDRVRILMYHGVSKQTFDPPYWTQLDYESFLRQMQYVKMHYTAIMASQLENIPLPRNAVVITFDDGLKNVYTNAMPVIKNLDLKAALFALPALSHKGQSIWPDRVYETIMKASVDEIDLTEFSLPRYDLKGKTTYERARLARELNGRLKSSPHALRLRVLDFLDTFRGLSEQSPHPEFRLMSMEELKTMAESGLFEIGLHTDTHPILSTQTREEQAAEIAGCMKKLEEAGIKYIHVFAYPNGRRQDFNDDTINILKDKGIRLALSTEDGLYSPGDDIYRIRRIPVGADMSRFEFAARLSGFYYFIRAIVGR